MRGVRALATYKFSTMNLALSTEEERTYRAGYRSLANMTILSMVMLALAYFGHRWAKGLAAPREPSPRVAAQMAQFEQQKAQIDADMRKAIGEEKWAEFKRKHEEDLRRRTGEREATRLRIVGYVQKSAYVLCGLAVLVAVMGPLSCLWGRVTIRVTPQGEVEVFERGTFFPTRRRWPIPDLHGIQIAAMGVERGSPRNRVWTGWHWQVRLVGDKGCVVFVPTVDPDRTRSAQFPAGVTELIDWLRARTGLPLLGRSP